MLSNPKLVGGWGIKNIILFGHALVEKSLWVFLSSDSLWRSILIAKYIEPGTIIDWIRMPRKPISNASCQWRVLINVFPLIGTFLARKVG
jgi:hypothetical protein